MPHALETSQEELVTRNADFIFALLIKCHTLRNAKQYDTAKNKLDQACQLFQNHTEHLEADSNYFHITHSILFKLETEKIFLNEAFRVPIYPLDPNIITITRAKNLEAHFPEQAVAMYE